MSFMPAKKTSNAIQGNRVIFIFRSTRKENISLKTSNDQISTDLERLLNQREVF